MNRQQAFVKLAELALGWKWMRKLGADTICLISPGTATNRYLATGELVWHEPDRDYERASIWNFDLPDLDTWEGAGLLWDAMEATGYSIVLETVREGCQCIVCGSPEGIWQSPLWMKDKAQAVFLAACRCYGVEYEVTP